MNYGDTFKGSAESGGFWENNEYDAPYCHLTEFLRGGDPRWLALGYEAARHLLDIDTCNFSRDPGQVGAQVTHMPGHVGGYLPPFFRSKMSGSSTMPSHMWVQGPVLHFLLTGDPFAAEVSGAHRALDDRQPPILLHRQRPRMRLAAHPSVRPGPQGRRSPLPQRGRPFIVEHILAAQSPGGGWERGSHRRPRRYPAAAPAR